MEHSNFLSWLFYHRRLKTQDRAEGKPTPSCSRRIYNPTVGVDCKSLSAHWVGDPLGLRPIGQEAVGTGRHAERAWGITKNLFNLPKSSYLANVTLR
jgi:hypothetical protein